MSCNHTPKPLTRRQALSMVGGGMGMVALSNMVSTSLQAATPEMVGTKGALPELHFKPKAKRVIFLFMNGGVSHVDTFDYKPMLDKYNGQPTPGRQRRHAAQDRQPDDVAVQVQEVRRFRTPNQ